MMKSRKLNKKWRKIPSGKMKKFEEFLNEDSNEDLKILKI
jgi:hypothetical protein